MVYHSIQRLQREDLAARCQQEHAHQLTAYAEAPATDAGNDLEPRVASRTAGPTQLGEVLDPRHLVARGSVILSELRFDHNLWVELVRDDEVGGLKLQGSMLPSF
jgi:hypothetical protein